MQSGGKCWYDVGLDAGHVMNRDLYLQASRELAMADWQEFSRGWRIGKEQHLADAAKAEAEKPVQVDLFG